ncbi:MAG: PLP-dependent aminotransferase family protein [Palaeococcus sp.]|uniref:aminotransferase-like domain-containing protein n=1 Tax=Palaeococcus sp. (in: euryarchaeotes) TaxID=2820298 RepID=UPI0025F952AE|nr:PLP-dependent aminotransferase family protein [Palaeococcus sp. (in: euryarchaeotes)]MCD6560050.1 PLP-dependent aminotransferase family protein [Palaeococcus sp. (in: euryarchaeotes)]
MEERLKGKLEAPTLNYEEYFSQKALGMKASEIRELLKLVESSEIISLAGGLPNPETFPKDIITELAKKAVQEHGDAALQYGTTKGYTPLRLEIAEMLRKRYDIPISKVDIMITSGSQQGLDLVGRVFIDPGDMIVVEAPTYLAAIQSFKYYEPQFIQIPLDDEGMRVDLLEEKLKELKAQGKKIKFVYTIPTFQNPGGVTMSIERRKRLLELASEYDFLIIEDGPYNELRYRGEEVPPIKALDTEGRVLYLGTFSKILAPGFRVAWVAGEPHFIRKLEIAKQGIDLCTNVISQVIAMEYMKGGYLDEQIPKIRAFYKPKLETMLRALEEYMPEGVKWTKPEGGMFVWVTLPEGIDTKAMFEKAVSRGVAYVPGEAFFADRSVKNTMRLNFTYVDDEKIVEGIKRLAEVIKEELKA